MGGERGGGTRWKGPEVLSTNREQLPSRVLVTESPDGKPLSRNYTWGNDKLIVFCSTNIAYIFIFYRGGGTTLAREYHLIHRVDI